MDAIKDQLSFYSKALELRGKRNNILASNIANAATPNFKARDISFLDELKKIDKSGPIMTSHENHIVHNTGNSMNETSYREPLITSLDGNTVELSVEQAKYGRAAAQYQATLRFLESDMSGIRKALRGD